MTIKKTNTYYLAHSNGSHTPLTKSNYVIKLRTGDFNAFEERDPETTYVIPGTQCVLMPKGHPLFDEIYRIHHNDYRRLREAVLRNRRRIDPETGYLCQGDCTRCSKDCYGRFTSFDAPRDVNGNPYEPIDLNSERNITNGIDRQEFRRVYEENRDKLTDMEQLVIETLHLTDESLEVGECAKRLNCHRNTVTNNSKSALAKLRTILADFADCEF
jgi:DNA-directed RNA polymerase specialized sigma24 family protein